MSRSPLVIFLAAGVALLAQTPNVPRGMFCGGNELRDMGALRAERVQGTVMDPTGAVIPRARIQLQVQGSEDILRDIEANDKGRFRLPRLRPGNYWLGISTPGFNLHFWELRIVRGSGVKTLRVELSLGT